MMFPWVAELDALLPNERLRRHAAERETVSEQIGCDCHRHSFLPIGCSAWDEIAARTNVAEFIGVYRSSLPWRIHGRFRSGTIRLQRGRTLTTVADVPGG